MVARSPKTSAPRTGTGSGIKLFCSGLGAGTPDIVNASRRMKAEEFQSCKANGVSDIIEIQESKPISKTKNWVVTRLVEKAIEV